MKSKILDLTPSLDDIESIKIIGLGGVGSIAARYLSLFLAAQKVDLRLVLIDGDEFELKNADRMFFNVLGNKADVLRKELLEWLGGMHLSIISVREYVNDENIENLIRERDLVLLCVDNHKTRKMISDHCAKLDNVCLVSGGNDGVTIGAEGDMVVDMDAEGDADMDSGAGTRGTYGNVQVYMRCEGLDVSPSLTDYHPEIEDPPDEHPDDLSCLELIESTPQVLFANLAVASAMLSTTWALLCGELDHNEVAFDILDAVMRPITWPVLEK